MFATDRDLLVLEPRLYHDIAWSAQRLVSSPGGTIDPTGTTLTLPGAAFDALGIDAGHVVLAGSSPYEVIARQSATSLSISRLRAETGDPPIPATSAGAAQVEIMTFAPQIALIHAQILQTVGLDPAGAASITNPRAPARVEALGALHLIFSAAAALVGDDQPLWVKAQMYRNRFASARRELAVEIDLDGDGRPEVIRRANVLQLVRA